MVEYSNTHYAQKSTLDNYDLCRHIPSSVLSIFAKTILDLSEYSSRKSGENIASILEQGVGNGRILIPVIKEAVIRGKHYELYAIDKSQLMLDNLAERLTPEQKDICSLYFGDIQEEMPYPNSSMDCIYTFATYHILNNPEQALDMMTKKLRQEGFFVFGKEFTQVFHGTENRIYPQDSEDLEGIDLIPCIQDFFCEYHRLRQEYGVPFEPSGVLYSDPSLVLEYLKEKGFDISILKGDELKYTKPHTLRQMMKAFKLRNITTFGSDLPDDIRYAMFADLLDWCNKNQLLLDDNLDVPASITFYVFSKNEK